MVQGKRFTIYDEAKKPARSERPARPENLLQTESLALSTLPRLGPERGGEQVRMPTREALDRAGVR